MKKYVVISFVRSAKIIPIFTKQKIIPQAKPLLFNNVSFTNTTAFGINKGSDGKIIEATTDISPTLVFSAPTSTDTDGVLLTSNVTATGNAVLNADGEITSINITNVGNGYVRDPKVSISSASSTERKAREVKEIVILALNHVAAEVNDPAFRSLINNNYFSWVIQAKKLAILSTLNIDQG